MVTHSIRVRGKRLALSRHTLRDRRGTWRSPKLDVFGPIAVTLALIVNLMTADGPELEDPLCSYMSARPLAIRYGLTLVRSCEHLQLRFSAPDNWICWQSTKVTIRAGYVHTEITAIDGLKNKCALVIGGSSGIGLEAACQFLAEGTHVAITGGDHATLDKARKELGDVLAIRADAGDVKSQRVALTPPETGSAL